MTAEVIMIQLNYFNTLFAGLQSSAHLVRGTMTGICLLTAFITLPSYAANTTSSTPISRSEAANPANFKFISVNGRGVSDVMESCPIRTGLINCAIKKLEIINGRSEGIDDDYDLAQSFVFPATGQPKTAVVVITRSGLMDDSISAQRYRVSFELKEDQRTQPGWHWVQYGEQFQCRRGSMAGKWSKKLCL